jgi:sugar lactone lactonase YvrE
MDDQGNLWIAMWGAGEVRCYSPSAAHRGAIEVPAPNTTSVAFIGPALDTLLITTAAEQLTDAQRAGFPDSGRLFTARVDARGCPVAAWAGSGAWPERFDDARMATRP